MIIVDIIIVVIVLMIAFNFKNRFRLFNKYDKSILSKLFFYHLLIGILFYLFISEGGGDATNYWFATYGFQHYNFQKVMELVGSGSATGYLLLLNYFPAKFLGLSFFSGTIIYTSLGYAGFVYFYAFIKENIPNIYNLKTTRIFRIPLFPFLLFLPNLHFWTTGVGKDTLLFFCVALFVYSIRKFKKRFIGLTIAILLSIFIRPHITLFLVVGFGIGYALDGRLNLIQKIGIFSIFLIGLLLMFDYVMNFIQLESIDLESIESYSANKSSSLASERTGSAVDTSSYPYPLKIFTFLYRPLFFDASGVLGILASLENMFLLIFSIKLFFSGFLNGFKKALPEIKSLFIFFLLGGLSFSLILGNLGIMLRQKVPFIMTFLIFGMWVILENKKNKKRFA